MRASSRAPWAAIRARAVTGRGSPALGALAVALTIAVHLLTGYLSLASIGVRVLLRPSRFLRRFLRAAVVGAGSLLIAAWVIVPIVLDRTWTPQSEISRGTIFYDSFGARRVLGWLLTGQIFDRDRLPVLTVLVGLGLLVCARGWRNERAKALLAAGLLALLPRTVSRTSSPSAVFGM